MQSKSEKGWSEPLTAVLPHKTAESAEREGFRKGVSGKGNEPRIRRISTDQIEASVSRPRRAGEAANRGAELPSVHACFAECQRAGIPAEERRNMTNSLHQANQVNEERRALLKQSIAW